MSKRKVRVQGTDQAGRIGERRTSAPGPAPPPVGLAPGHARLKRWVFRLALVVLVPLAFLILAEVCLRALGYGYPTTFFVTADSGKGFITNQKFAWQFYSPRTALKPFLFTVPASKPAGTVRVCVLGESAAQGTPDPAFSFGRCLEVMLRRSYPERRFEIINAAMRGINSYVIRSIARECAAYQVDVLLVYAGNNEVVGLHAPDPGSPPWKQSLALIRLAQWLRSTRLGQLAAARISERTAGAQERERQDMAYFRSHTLRPDDWRRTKVRQNFQANLEAICRAGLSQPDQARWETAYDTGRELEAKGLWREAVQQYLAAASIDNQFADLHFRLGRCYSEMDDAGQARARFALARDWDALQFRTDSAMNEVIRKVAASSGPGTTLLEVERAFAEGPLAEQGVPGVRLFHDHVHPTFVGNYLLARTCYTQLTSMLEPGLGPAMATRFPTPEQCAEFIGYTLYDDLNVEAAMVRLQSGPPFLDQLDHARRQAAAEAELKRRLGTFDTAAASACVQTYLAAIREEPDWWPARFNLGALYLELGRPADAAQQFQSVVTQFPRVKRFRLSLADALLKAGDKPGALARFREAFALEPEDPELRKTIERLTLGL